MKYFILIITLYYLYTILYSIINIKKTPTQKQIIDKTLASPQFQKEKDINKQHDALVITYTILNIIVTLFLILSAIYVGTFIFTVITFIYILWSLYDVNNSIQYINSKKENKDIIEEYKMPKTFDSKLYKIFSIPFDLGFALYVIYIVFTRWN